MLNRHRTMRKARKYDEPLLLLLVRIQRIEDHTDDSEKPHNLALLGLDGLWSVLKLEVRSPHVVAECGGPHGRPPQAE